MKKKIIILLILAVGVSAFAVFMYMQAEQAKREAAVMQDLQHQMLKIGKYAPKIIPKIFVNYYDECPGEGLEPVYSPTGMDVANYCAGVTTDATTVTRKCLVLTLDKMAGYGEKPPIEEAAIKELACGIAGAYPPSSEDWQDTTLDDHLNNILMDYVNKVLK